MLENIHSPKDIQTLDRQASEALAEEIREKIIQTVSKNGGHLGSNLGFVEGTIVLHKLFDVPKDTLIFDVGHQCYTHKLLTGRYDRFDTLRQNGGISGFTNRFESPYDAFTAGHSGSALSTALGVATAKQLVGDPSYTVCVIGDGSFTNGMVYEALNNCENKSLRLIIVLNDNEMSISHNVGNLANYLSKLSTSSFYYRFKRGMQKCLRKIPVVGEAGIRFFRHIKNGIKRALYKQPFFTALGVRYIGPVDGNDMERLEVVLEEAKHNGSCTLVHIKTKKGLGYLPAEETPERYHSVGAFDVQTGVKEKSAVDYSKAFGKILCQMAQENEKLCAITSAMCDGTGLTEFAKQYPKRFFDVGIAEEHEIAFASGLASRGFVPVCALYSTFCQRTYDQLIHDVAIQKMHLVLALDRAGFVPGDGETHQGIFDCAFIKTIPHTEIYSPDDFDKLKTALEKAVHSDKLSVVRYPKGTPIDYDKRLFVSSSQGHFAYRDFGKCPPELVVFSYGRMNAHVVQAAERAGENGKNVRVICLFKVHPLAECIKELVACIGSAQALYFVEEGVRTGGIAESLTVCLQEQQALPQNIKIKAIDQAFPPHGSVKDLEKLYGFDVDTLTNDMESM